MKMIIFCGPGCSLQALKRENGDFAAPCDVLHIATFLILGAMCDSDVHSRRPFPALQSRIIHLESRHPG
jgi:hypothetical protein